MQQLVTDYMITFNSESGKRVLEDLMEFAGYKKACFHPGLPDHTAFDLGQRNIILRTLKILEEKED